MARKKIKLKRLEQANGEALMAYTLNLNYDVSVKNGIACPNCGGELMDTTPNITLTSLPPQKEIHCKDCGFRGFRFV